VCSLSHAIIPSSVLSPSKSIGVYLFFPEKNLIVGKPLIATPGTSLAVESQSAITIFLLCFNFSAAASHFGANDLQCPHHGA